MKTEWNYNIPNPMDTIAYVNALGINKIVAQTLINRGVSISSALKLLNESDNIIQDALELKNIDNAADLIVTTLKKKKSAIEIFGDYDTDGITSTTIAYQALYDMHDLLNPNGDIDINWTIPERNDGYGISKTWCEEIIKKYKRHKVKPLVITVDNGITKRAETNLLIENGYDVLITDHHMPDYNGQSLPTCIVVDPKCDKYEVGDELAGCGVIWNILKYIEQREKLDDIMSKYEYLMAIGTVGDMMKMTQYHLAIVKKGLEYINSSSCPMWLKLLKDIAIPGSQVTSKDFGWTIAPMINACAQDGCAKLGAETILEIDVEQINNDVCSMKDHYETIKKITKDEKAKAEAAIMSGDYNKHNFIIYTTANKHSGIAGKVAAHLANLTNKPAMVITSWTNKEEELNGSARNSNISISMLNILKVIEKEGLIVSANGHTFACGCKILRSKLDQAQKRIDEIIQEQIDNKKITVDPIKNINIDCIIKTEDINSDILRSIDMFPYAKGFEAPVICLNEAEIVGVKTSSNNEKNVCYTVKTSHESRPIDIWVWNKKPYEYDRSKHSKISIVGNLEKNFMNPKYATISVIDIAFS